MINYATDAPPESITINGTAYPAETDYRVWLQVSDLLCNLDSASDQEAMLHNLNTVQTLEALVFGRVLNEPVLDVLNACAVFYRGYPAEGNGYRPETDSVTGEKLFSFKHDINLILIAIRNQSGIDLSYRRKEPYHWWLFLLEFRSLESRHHICQVIGWRGYTGDDPKLLEIKRQYALPQEYTRDEQRAIDEMERIFYAT